MFFTRLISGIVLLVIMIAAMILGGDVLFFLAALLSFIGLYELYKTYNIHKNMLGYLGMGAAVIYVAAVRIQTVAGVEEITMAGLMTGFLLLMFVYVFTFPKFKADQAAWAVFGLVYVPVLMMCMYQVRMLEDGLFLIPLIFLAAWGNDTCAYCVGRLIGRHKMAPVLSPKKSVEGAVGGIVGAVILGLIYGYFLMRYLPSFDTPVFVYGIICGVGALIAIVGDLAASAIKRNLGIKDYGKLIPGHGGVLDRFDSILFTAPVVYFLGLFIG
ncbi:phosphatidate cytidylyltransferase [Catenibacillus scindens]|uniref:Phosphatidate cytidylyltransferase n=1 Tax=Catenibacillus scindens TaxID=673271 RepID=A0A7W8H754_9FIRM|nr:phosphatidate cytidylyltransferase [Catenibacillus scindens]MBB5263136.1 phosphatidate cytidylyltransferase [Catenibacillus scindens]